MRRFQRCLRAEAGCRRRARIGVVAKPPVRLAQVAKKSPVVREPRGRWWASDGMRSRKQQPPYRRTAFVTFVATFCRRRRVDLQQAVEAASRSARAADLAPRAGPRPGRRRSARARRRTGLRSPIGQVMGQTKAVSLQDAVAAHATIKEHAPLTVRSKAVKKCRFVTPQRQIGCW